MVEAGVVTWEFTILPLTFVKINIKVLLCAQCVCKWVILKAHGQSMTVMEFGKGLVPYWYKTQ